MPVFSRPEVTEQPVVPLHLRARRRWREWSRHGNAEVVRWIREGVRIPWLDSQKPLPFNKTSQWEKHASPAELACAREEINRFVLMGAVKEISRAEALYLSPIFVVPKPRSTRYRLILDFRWMNTFTKKRKFKAEPLGHLESLLEKDDQMISWDMEDGFHLLGIHVDYQKYFQFQFEGRFYQYLVLPFGWTLSPVCYTKTMRVFNRVLRKEGLKIHAYVDDYLLAAKAGLMDFQKRRVLHWMARLGLSRKPGKGHWEPSTQICHLGVHIDTHLGRMTLDPDNAAKLVRKGRQIVAICRHTKRRVATKSLQSFLGACQFATIAVPELATYLRLLYDAVDQESPWSRLSGAQVKRVAFIHHLIYSTPAWHMWVPLPRTWVVTDASEQGWGGHVVQDQRTIAMASGHWTTREQMFHITRKETRAPRRVLQALKDQISGPWGLGSDASATVGCFRKRASKSPALQKELLATLRFLTKNQLPWPQAVLKIATHDNTVADSLSRLFYAPPSLPCPIVCRLHEVLPLIARLRREGLPGRIIGLPQWDSQAYRSLLDETSRFPPSSPPSLTFHFYNTLKPKESTDAYITSQP
jgi:hypothetical protein